MKAFEEWSGGEEYYAGWKAALEWVLSWETDPESIEIIRKVVENKKFKQAAEEYLENAE